jgi:hypothetical protein
MNIMFWRGFLVEGDPGTAIASAKEALKVYPLGGEADAAPMEFYNVSGKSFNTIHSNNAAFYSEVWEVIDSEPAAAVSPEILGLLAGIGVEKGEAFSVSRAFSTKRLQSATQLHGQYPFAAATRVHTFTRAPGGSIRSLVAVMNS